MTTESKAPETLSDTELDSALSEEGIIPDDGVEESDTPPEPPEDSTQSKEPKTPAQPTIEERLALMEKRIKDKDDFIAKQGDEIGKLRKLVVPEPKKQLHEVKADNFFEDPVASVEKITENQRIRLEQEHELRTQALRDEIERRRETMNKLVPDYENNVDSILDVLKQDGFNEEGLKNFKANPHSLEPAVSYNLYARAKLIKENSALKEEINRLKGNPKKILDKVETISRQKPKISSAVVSSADTDEIDIYNLTEKQIARLTNKQLEELLKKKTKR